MRRTSNSARGQALTAFLGIALVLVLGLTLWMRVRPEAFGIVAPSTSPPTPEVETLAAAPPEPSGPLGRYVARPVAAALPFGDRERRRIELFRDARRSVCQIEAFSAGRRREGEDVESLQRGTGTGFIWDRLGHVVTSYHVVEGALFARVRLANGSVHDGWLVGLDREHDLAVMRIDAPPEVLEPLRFGRSHDLLVGQQVYSIGYPYELQHTFSEGMICGLDRSLRTTSGVLLDGLIQTDADLHPGSSGGPILDSSARVIGIATAVHGDARHGTGVAFALPVDVMQAAVPRIMREGMEWFPELGLVLESDSNSRALIERAREDGTRVGEPWAENVPDAGVIIAIVEADSPAEAAGLRALGTSVTTRPQVTLRDIIVSVNGRAVASRDELDRYIDESRDAESMTLGIARSDGVHDVELSW